MKTLIVVFAGAALAIIQSILGRLPAMMPVSDTVRRRLERIRPAVVLLLWLLFGLWALETLFGDSPLYPVLFGGLVGVLILMFAWFLLRDLVAGVIYSTKHPDSLNRRISAGKVSGRILKAGLTGIQVAADGGEVLSVPYSHLVGEVIVEDAHDQSSPRFKTSLSLAGIPGDVDSVRKSIERDILLSPWVNHLHPPSIRFLGSGNSRTAEVVFHCLNDHHAAMVEEHLRHRYTVVKGESPESHEPSIAAET